MGALDEAARFRVDLRGRFFGIVLPRRDLATEEYHLLGFAEGHRTECFAHAVLHDEIARKLGRSLKIVRRAGRNVAKDKLLRNVTGHHHGDIGKELRLRLEALFLERKLQGIPARAAAAYDRNLLHRIGVLQACGHQRMTGLVVRGDLLFFVRDDAALAFGAEDHFLDRIEELLLADRFFVLPGRRDRRLVHKIRKVRSGEARGANRDAAQVDACVELLAARVDREDRLAVVDVGKVEDHAPVEAAGAEERRIENIGPVRRRKHNDLRIAVETVHLDEDLVQGLFALVVPAAQPSAPLAAHRVYLIDEENGRGGALRGLEGVAGSGCAYADEHLNELRGRDIKERPARLARDRAGEKRLPRARRAHEEHAARDARADVQELFWILQKINDLLEFLLRLFEARDVLKGRTILLAAREAQVRAAERERLVHAALRLAEHEEKDAADDEKRHERRNENTCPEPEAGLFLDLDRGRGERLLAHAIIFERFGKTRFRFFFRARRRSILERHLEVVAGDHDLCDLAGAHPTGEVVQGQRRRRRHVLDKEREEESEREQHGNRNSQIADKHSETL